MKPIRGGRAKVKKNTVRSKKVTKQRPTRASQKKRIRDYVESASTSVCSTCCSSVSSRSGCSSASTVSDHKNDNKSSQNKKGYYRTYRRIKTGLRKSIPAAIVLWAFHKMPTTTGLTSRRVINFLKRHYRVADNPRKTGKSISSMLRSAVEFGLIQKRGNRYFLTTRNR